MTAIDTLTPEQIATLQNVAAITALRDGVRERIGDIDIAMSRGQVKRVAHTRGYLDALHDLDNTLTNILEGGAANG